MVIVFKYYIWSVNVYGFNGMLITFTKIAMVILLILLIECVNYLIKS